MATQTENSASDDMPALEPVSTVTPTFLQAIPEPAATTTTTGTTTTTTATATTTTTTTPAVKDDDNAEKERLLSELQWDYDQTPETLNIRIELPKDMNKVNRKSLGVKLEETHLTVRIEGRPFVDWTLYAEVEVGEEVDQWAITDGRDGAKVINVDLVKKEKDLWPYVIQLPFLGNGSGEATGAFLTDEQVAACRKAEIEQEKKEGASAAEAAAETVPLGDDGIKLEAETEAFASEAEQATPTPELWGKAIQALSSSDTAEGVRLLRLLAVHRTHVPSCLNLHGIYGDTRFWGVPKSAAKANWFLHHATKAPKEDLMPAVFLTLAKYYEDGEMKLPQSLALAIKYYQKGAEMGHGSALTQLAALTMKGHLGSMDASSPAHSRPTHAGVLLQAALRRGCPYAHVILGNWHLRAEVGYPKDLATAKAHYDKAVRWLPPIRALVPSADLNEAERLADGLPPSTTTTTQPSEVEEPGQAGQPESRVAKLERNFFSRAGAAGGESTSASGGRGDKAARGAAAGGWFSVRFWERVGTLALGVAVLLDVYQLSHPQSMPL